MTYISNAHLLIGLLPAIMVIMLVFWWTRNWFEGTHATVRMVIQLLLVGYVLTYIFSGGGLTIVLTVLFIMIVAASWIAVRSIKMRGFRFYLSGFIAITFGGGAPLLLVVMVVLQASPWYDPRIFIPLAGMAFSNAMNAVGLAAERFESEFQSAAGDDLYNARNVAYKAALIPQFNTFFAVGLVSLPGMMTGQILAGVEPIVAVRYQIVIMSLVLGVAGLSAAIYLLLVQRVVSRR